MAKKRRIANIFDSSKEELEQISQNIIRNTSKNTPNPTSAALVEKTPVEPKPVPQPKAVTVKPAPKPKPEKADKAKLKVFWIEEQAHRMAKTAASRNGLTIRDYVEKLIQDDNA